VIENVIAAYKAVGELNTPINSLVDKEANFCFSIKVKFSSDKSLP